MAQWIRSFSYFATFLVFGMTIGMSGPVLMDLLLVYFNYLDIIGALAWILFTQASTRFIGAISAGVLADRFLCNYNRILAFCMASNALLHVVIPLSRELWCLILLMALSGLFAGVMDTVTNIALINVHGIKVAPYLQCLYFSYGFGAFISPLIAEPFLIDKSSQSFSRVMQFDSAPYNNTSTIFHEAIDKSPLTDPMFWLKKPSHIEVPFWIVAILHIPVTCSLLFVGFTSPVDDHGRNSRIAKIKRSTSNDRLNEDEDQENVEEGVGQSDQLQKRMVALMTILTSIVVFIFDGLQGTFGGYIFTYAKAINMSAAQGAVLTSLFWGSLATGRLLSIPLAAYFLPSSMLKLSLCPCSYPIMGATIAFPVDVVICNKADVCFYPQHASDVINIQDGSLLVVTFTSDISSVMKSSIFKTCWSSAFLITAIMMLFHNERLAIWLGTCWFALSMGNIFPSSLAMVEQHFPVTGTIACAFVVSAAIGESIIPLMVGELFDHHGTIVFMACAVILCTLAGVTFVILRVITVKWYHKEDLSKSSEELDNG